MNDKNLSLELAKCLEWMEKTGRGPEAAAKRYPHHFQELIKLLQTVEQLDTAEKPAPSQEFLSVARTRLANRINAESAAVPQSNVTKSTPFRHIWQNKKMGSITASHREPQRRFAMNWILIIGLIASVFAGGGGVAYASTEALPGDSLYPVKTMLQDMEMIFASDEKDAELLMTQLFTNIEEMQQLADQERYGDMLIGLKEYQANLEEMNQLRTRVNFNEGGTETSLNTRIQQQLQTCTELLEQLQIKLQTRLQTQDQEKLQTELQTQDKVQTQLQEAIQLTETGNTYGPNEEPGQPEEPGDPNGAGPGEPQGTQTQDQNPEDSGNPDTGCQGDGCNTDQNPGGPAEDPGKGPGSGGGGGKP